MKVTGTTNTVKWATNSKSVATVSSKGIVKARTEGTATITATVNRKKYSCKVTVKHIYTTEEAEKKIEYEVIELKKDETYILILENTNKIILNAQIDIKYYDSSGNKVWEYHSFINAFEPGRKAVCLFYGAVNNIFLLDTEYDRFEIEFHINFEDVGINYIKYIAIIDSIENNGESIVAVVTNNSDVKINEIDMIVLYYDDDKIVGYSRTENFDLPSGDSETVEFNIPTGTDGFPLEYNDYEIIINEAYE